MLSDSKHTHITNLCHGISHIIALLKGTHSHYFQIVNQGEGLVNLSPYNGMKHLPYNITAKQTQTS